MQPTTSASKRGRKPLSFAAVVLAMVSVTAQMIALAAVTGGLAVAPRNSSTPVVASALLRGMECASGDSKSCPATPQGALAGSKTAERIEVPSGAAPCPNSGAGASCTQAAAAPQAGTSAVPNGLAACPSDADKPALTPAACQADAAPGFAGGAPVSLHPEIPTIALSMDKNVLASRSTAQLLATTSRSVTGTPWAIEIFDVTSRALLGACSRSAACAVAYTGTTGNHTFIAYVMTPGQKLPGGNEAAASNRVEARWLGVDIAADQPSIVAPGKPITFTASASENVSPIGYLIEIRDAKNGQRLTFCSQGTTCSTSLVEPTAGTRSVVADLVAQSPAVHASTATLNPTSGTASGTWLGVDLQSSSAGRSVSFTATANADLSRTPWSIFILSENGKQVGQPCNAGTCSATINVAPNDSSKYRAVIGRFVAVATETGPAGSVLGHPSAQVTQFDLQATSALVRPTRLLWGVDSCQSYTDDPNGGSGLLPQVISTYGTPGFWGRYLPNTGNCPGLSGAEIKAAHAHHMAILSIYNDYDCSNVSGNSTGSSYALSAIEWAWNDIIPQGTAIAIDIEPAGDACPGAANVDKGFIEGWYDQLKRNGYVPAFYGDTAPDSAFAGAWCAAVAERPDIAPNSYLWSFEPSLLQGHGAQQAPVYGPYNAGCAGHYTVWQYSLSAGDDPNVDVDLATTDFPFWWP